MNASILQCTNITSLAGVALRCLVIKRCNGAKHRRKAFRNGLAFPVASQSDIVVVMKSSTPDNIVD